MDAAAQKPTFWKMLAGFPANFWFANLMEMLERLAFFGVRAILPLYLVKQANENGLGLSYDDKGTIYFWWALLQCLVPMISGGYTERYGYRKSLVVAFILNIIGYVGMARALPISQSLAANGWTNAGFWVFMAASCFVAVGTAIFKPAVHGTIARTTDEKTSSMGFGLFYWVVNIGGALAPMLAAELRVNIDWDRVFYGAAIVTAANFLPAFLLYREPEKAPRKPGEVAAGPVGVFVSSIWTVLKDLRLVVFLLIFSCFWLMFMQLWDLMPNFIDEWVNTSDVAPVFGWVAGWLHLDWILPTGQVKPEIIINIDSWSIILLVLVISWLIGRMNKVAAMVLGMIIALVGFVGAGWTQIGILCSVMIFVFAVGEMICSPTFTAYVAVIAPPDKKALYMGYSNIPFAIGWAVGNKVGAWLYGAMGAKFELARRYLVANTGITPEAAKAIQDEQVMQQLADTLHGGAGGTVAEATQLLWDMHHPYMVWVYLGLFGLVGTLGMIVFYLATRRSMAARKPAGEQPADQPAA